MKHALQVIGLGEQVDQVHLLDAISGAEQASQITRDGRRIAGDVGHPVRSQSDEALDHTFPQTAPWRVHHHEIGPQLAGRAPQEIEWWSPGQPSRWQVNCGAGRHEKSVTIQLRLPVQIFGHRIVEKSPTPA